MKIKAAVCREFAKPLSIEETELAAPGAGEIRVNVAACAICHSDIHYADGAWGGDLPSVYGHEASGTVVEIGAGVEEFTIGDRVVVTLIRSCGQCFHCLVVLGSKMGSSKIHVDIPKLVSLYQRGDLMLDELISGRYPLEEINEAIASVNRGEALRNVIVF